MSYALAGGSCLTLDHSVRIRTVMCFGLAGLLHSGSIDSPHGIAEVRCSCLAVEDLASAVSAADAVFVGTVVSSVVTSDTLVSEDEDGLEIVLPTRVVGFQVWSAWKGTIDAGVEVRTGTSGADCGFPFEEGEAYLVFARSDDDALTTGLCSRTAALAEALGDVVELGSPSFVADRE